MEHPVGQVAHLWVAALLARVFPREFGRAAMHWRTSSIVPLTKLAQEVKRAEPWPDGNRSPTAQSG